MSTNHLLEVRDLTVNFGRGADAFTAVEHVSFHVDRGETLVILGESGSGKSVTAATILDLLDRPPAEIVSGEILYKGRNLFDLGKRERRRINGYRIAMVFQDPLAHLNPVLTVGAQIAEVFRVHGRPTEGNGRREAIALLERVGIPEAAARVDQYPHQFSGGQRQRVMIAMAIALEPELLVADEPTTALDVAVQLQILKLLKQLKAEAGMGLILITHDLAVAAHMADRVAVMRGGRVVETGAVDDILKRPQHPYTRSLVDASPNIHREDAGPPDPAAVPLLRVRELCKGFLVSRGAFRKPKPFTAVDHVSFDLARGETLGIVGESGSGKSTVARSLVRMYPPSGGKVEYRGRDVFAMDAQELAAFRGKVQMVFQDPFSSLNPKMSILEIVSEPLTIRTGTRPHAWADRVAELLNMVGLRSEHAARYPHQFSGGQAQRIAIARALASEPELIICDEAVSALDALIQVQIVELLADLRERLKLSYIFITHDLALVRDFSDHLLVMKNGQVVEAGPTAAVFANPSHPYTMSLFQALPRPVPEHA